MFAVFYFVVAHLQEYGAFVDIINKLKRTETRCNYLNICCVFGSRRHTAAHCYTLQHTATQKKPVSLGTPCRPSTNDFAATHTATRCNTLQHTATYWTLQHTATQPYEL